MAKRRVSYKAGAEGHKRSVTAMLATLVAAAALAAVVLAAPRVDPTYERDQLSNTQEISARPDLAMSPGGSHAAVVWTEGYESGNDKGHVFLRVFSLGNWGNRITVFSGGADECAYKAAVATTNSQAHVVYVSFDECNSSAGAQVRYATCSLGGSCTDEGEVVSVEAPQRILALDLALDADGNPHLVWSQYANETANGTIRYKAHDGDVWGGRENVYTGGDSHKPAIAWANDYVHVVWQEGEPERETGPTDKTKVGYRRRSTSSWDPTVETWSDLGWDLSSPDVAARGSRVFAAWDQCSEYEGTGNYCIRYNLAYRRSNDNGKNGTWSVREVGTDNTVFAEEYSSVDSTVTEEQEDRYPYWEFLQPSIALNDDGWPAVVWHADYSEGDGDEYRVYYTYAISGTDTGVDWSSGITPTLLNNSNWLGSAVVGVTGEPGDMQLHVVEMENSPPWAPTWDIWHDYYDWYEGEGGSRWKYVYLPLVLKGY